MSDLTITTDDGVRIETFDGRVFTYSVIPYDDEGFKPVLAINGRDMFDIGEYRQVELCECINLLLAYALSLNQP